MTKAQWVFEYVALLEREKEERTFHVKAFRNVLIQTFGLDIPNKMKGEEDPEAFTPLIMLAGNHHLLKAIMDEIDKNKEGKPSTITDVEYEEQSKRMEAGMEPLDEDPFAGMSLKELLQKKDAQILGVQVQDEDDAFPLPMDAEPVVFTSPPKQESKQSKVHPISSFDLTLLDEEGTSHSRSKTRRPLVQDEE